MKKTTFICTLILLAVILFQCNTPTPATSSTTPTTSTDPHSSQNALDWDGIYRGVLPCADCPGIQTTIYLNRDLTYLRRTKYLDRNDSAQESKGNFSWNAAGNTITLLNADGPASYFVGENTLTQLDMSGNKITGNHAAHYILSKSAYAVLNRYWKLVELMGKPVLVDSTFIKEPHLILQDDGSRIVGNGGCNGFSGSFEISPSTALSFQRWYLPKWPAASWLLNPVS
nr:copper resistance protein NlpE N-terminal domain-containing protein [Paraflavitalea speifideiaquila]